MGHPQALRGAQFKNQCLLLCFKEIHTNKILCLSRTHIYRHREVCFTSQTQPGAVLATNGTQLWEGLRQLLKGAKSRYTASWSGK